MKKLLIFVFPLLTLSGCRKDLTSLNVDPKSPSVVPSTGLFTNAQRELASTVASSNVNLNIFRLIEQHWTQTTYTDESNYDIFTREIPGFLWTTMYRDVLRDFQEARTLIATEEMSEPVRKNQLAVVDIMEVYSWYYLVTTFGNIPYTEALNIDNPFPKYDDQAAIFTDLVKRLDSDITALDIKEESLGTADIVYGGDAAQWKKFAASLKLKVGMTLADADPAASKAAVESAIATGIFTSNADNAEFRFLASPPNTNPIWEDLVQSGRKDFVGAATFVDTLKFFADPRLPLYFTPDASTVDYSGGKPGASNNYATFSKPATTITSPDFPGVLLDYSEIEFFLAEAVERGYAVPGTAAEHYNNAITASIEYWGGSMADVTTYLADPKVNYATAGADFKQKIGFQKWIALYNRGWDAWTETRRLDAPTLPAPELAISDFPVRLTYSVDEQNINTTNYNTAAKAIGEDKVTTKLFWDKF